MSVRPSTLSIAIVNWNTRDMLGRCLASIHFDAELAPWLSIETIVVDNASTDGSVEMIKERFPWARLIENHQNVGFARANNQALQSSESEYVLLLNSDTEVQAGALGTMVGYMQAHPQAGAVGSRLLNSDGTLQPSCHPMLTPGREFWRLTFLDQLWRRATYPMHRWDVNLPRRVEVIQGACLAMRRAALEEIGWLDEGYFMYTEEVDLCYRLLLAGWQLWWVPDATVVHHGQASSSQVAEDMYIQLYRSKVQFYRKFGGSLRAERFKRLLWLAYWPRLSVASVVSLFSSSLSVQALVWRRLLSELPAM